MTTRKTATPSSHGIASDLAPLARPITDLRLLVGNPRVGDVHAVAKSLERFGQRKPIVVDADGVVIAGNHTLQAAQRLGWTHVAAVSVSDDATTAKAYALADNRTAELGGYDEDALAAMIRDVQDVDVAMLADTGWTGDDLAAVLDAVPNIRDGIEPYNDNPTSDDYYTPAWVFEALGLTFDLDVASPPVAPEWIPAKRRYTIEDDGLASPWEGLVWMNPPYSKPGPWVEKFVEHGNGVALLPTSKAKWFCSLWSADVLIVITDKPFEFVGGGIAFQTFFAAVGPEAETAVSNLGTVRRRVDD